MRLKQFGVPKYISLIIVFFIFIALFLVINIGLRRHQFEALNRSVDMVVSSHDLRYLSSTQGMSEETVLKKLKEDAGISSIALEEDTLESLVEEGKCTLLTGAEIENMLRVGRVYRHILSHLANKVDAKKSYLVVDEEDIYSRIKEFLIADLGIDNVSEVGWNILEVTGGYDDLLEIGLGLSQKKADLYVKNGMSIVPRLRNSHRLNDALLSLKFLNLASLPQQNTIVFDGEEVLGYPNHIDMVAEKMRDLKLNYGRIEFLHQKGGRSLAMNLGNAIIQVHSIPEGEMLFVSKSTAVKRFALAVKERGNRLLFLHPFTKEYTPESMIAFNLNYFSEISTKIQQAGYTIEPVSKLPFSQYVPILPWETALISVGLFSIVLLLFHLFIPLSHRRTMIAYAIFGMAMGLFFLLGQVTAWNRIMALITAVVFPSLAMISQFPREPLSKTRLQLLLLSGWFLVRLLAICLIGCLFIIAFLSNTYYLSGVYQYFGVKFSFILPMVIIGLFFFLRPHRIGSLFYVFNRLFYSPIRTGALSAVFFCLVFVCIYILRSGNYISLDIPLLEKMMREGLEDLLFIRPRTKEFLIGYPVLFFVFYQIDRKISRNWLWFYTLLGAVSLISVMNSFCHIHTPILISVYRSFLGVALGVCVGLLYIGVFKAFKLMFQYKTS